MGTLWVFGYTVHANKSISDSFQIERNMIVVAVFRLIMNQADFRLVHIIEMKTATTIILLSILKESERDFSECAQ